MNLLLDTHVILWAAYDPDALSKRATQMLLDPQNSLCFSVASLWEVAIKRGLERPDFRIDPNVLRAGLLSNGYTEVPIDGRHALAVMGLPALHRDPFDRMLVAQASAEGLTLVTADREVAAYSDLIELV